MKLTKCYVGIGSNLGNREDNIKQAIIKLSTTRGVKVKKISPIYETDPVGGPSQPKYLNGAIEIDTELQPRRLLENINKIEAGLGRVRRMKNGPRTIDLDILLYGNETINEKGLRVPHPRMHQREFVLRPLSDIIEMNIKVYKTIDPIRKVIRKAKRQGKTIGFVPTMGYLHEGHLSLIRKARKESDICVVSIFVNPTQFGPKEDIKRYPRDMARDLKLCKLNNVDIVFAPSAKEMYKDDARAFVDIEALSENLCGAKRPGHFRGVATVVTKLFNIVEPDIAYFGQKDAQQAVIIKKIAEDLNIPINIKVMPIVREADGLAMSSRNTYLNTTDRKKALSIYGSLKLARSLYRKGERDASKIIKKMKDLLSKEKNIKIDYVSIVDGKGLKDIKKIKRGALVAVAVVIGKTRLIDNIVLK